MRSAIDDIAYGLRRNLGGMVAGREPYYGQQNRFTLNGVPGLDAEEASQRTGSAPLPISNAPVARGLEKMRRRVSITDPMTERFVNQSSDQNPFSMSERNALIAPYGYRIDQLVEE
jgi:hypothetical protein